MLGAADVQVDRDPVLLFRRIAECPRILGIEIAQVVPARARPLWHGVGLAFVLLAVAGDVDPCRGLAKRWLWFARGFVISEFGQFERQFVRAERLHRASRLALRI